MISTSSPTRPRAGTAVRRRRSRPSTRRSRRWADGTIHVLRGTYPITQQLVVNKPGVTIRARRGRRCCSGAIVPFLLTGGDDTLTVSQ
ncbi:MAG: hypothetical protein ACLUEK_09340 [Oscillospiraceae bacterium]